jgi:CubicO group peptidase (beta-lactamase class C family)
LIYEEYLDGTSDDLRPVWSVSKSVISALLGIARDSGFINGLDQKMIDFFPEFKGDSDQAGVNLIALKHLLTMSSGVIGDVGAPDPRIIKRAIGRSKIEEPGSRFAYNEADPAIVSMIVGKATRQNTLDFATRRLFKPLGIDNSSWASRKDYPCGSSDLCLRTRDMAKIGYLYLNNGNWDGKQILSADWIRESTTRQIETKEGELPNLTTYGYFW